MIFCFGCISLSGISEHAKQLQQARRRRTHIFIMHRLIERLPEFFRKRRAGWRVKPKPQLRS